jgi:hypothetical protein
VTSLEVGVDTATLVIRLEREEIPVFWVKDAVVKRETVTRAYQGSPDSNKQLGRDLIQVFFWIILPMAVVALPVILVLMLSGGMPDSHYGPPVLATTLVKLREGPVSGDASTRAWRGIPLAAVTSTPEKGASTEHRADSEGLLRIDRFPVAEPSRETPRSSASP